MDACAIEREGAAELLDNITALEQLQSECNKELQTLANDAGILRNDAHLCAT